jgi:hypothetical protein
MPDSFLALRELAVRAGDTLATLMAYGPAGFPTPEGRSFEQSVNEALVMLAELASATKVEWKRHLIERVGLEVQHAHDALVRERNTARADGLLQEAYDHFGEYLAGEPPR